MLRPRAWGQLRGRLRINPKNSSALSRATRKHARVKERAAVGPEHPTTAQTTPALQVHDWCNTIFWQNLEGTGSMA
jgi:hypothetical protein